MRKPPYIQRGAFSCGIPNTVMNVISIASDKTESTVMYRIPLLKILISCVHVKQITDSGRRWRDHIFLHLIAEAGFIPEKEP